MNYVEMHKILVLYWLFLFSYITVFFWFYYYQYNIIYAIYNLITLLIFSKFLNEYTFFILYTTIQQFGLSKTFFVKEISNFI